MLRVSSNQNYPLPEPFLGFLSPDTAEKVEPVAKEVARILFQNDSITVNWGLVVGALIAGLLCKLSYNGWVVVGSG